jgi:hypothetical protein
LCAFGGGRSRAGVIRSQSHQKFTRRPYVVRDSGSHGGCHAEALVTAAEVVVREPKGNRGPVVLELAAEASVRSVYDVIFGPQ